MQKCIKQIRLILLTKSNNNKRYASTTTLLAMEEMPSPKGLPIVGTTLSLIAAGAGPKLHKYIDGRHAELGPIFKENIGPVSAVFVSEPAEMPAVFLQEGKYPIHLLPEAWIVYNKLHGCLRGLFFMDGEEWLCHRKIMNNILLKGDLSWIDNCCEFVSDIMVERINKNIGNNLNNEFSDLENNLYKWSLDVLLCVLLGVDNYKVAREQYELDTMKLSHIIHKVFETSVKLNIIPASLASKFKLPVWNRFEHSVTTVLDEAKILTTKLINNVTSTSTSSSKDGLLPKLLQHNISSDNINRIIADLVLAAGDTTAYAMEWILYLLSKHKQIQQQLRDAIIANETQPLLRNIIKETLRLYPVAPFLTRILPTDSTICGYNIPAGTLIILSIYTSGRNASYFKNPTTFNPDRWNRNNENYMVGMHQATLPFAMGARSCIGKRIAEAQLQLTVAKIVENFDVELCNRRDVEMILRMVSVPSEPIQLKFHRLN